MNSFDVFDTLIGRRFISSHMIWETIAAESQDEDFIRLRLAADNGQRDLIEIYDTFGGTDAQLAREIELEIQNSFPIAKNMARVKHGDLLISDMYLPGSVIMQMVRHAGLDKQVTIYRSNADKANGTAWQKLRPELHLGDNQHSDVTMPKQAGINAEHYSGTHLDVHEQYLYDQGLHILALLVRETRLRLLPDEYTDIATQFNLPLLFCFAELVYRRKQEHPVVFLGRDCFLLSKIYKEYYGNCTYLPFSRSLAYTSSDHAVAYLLQQTPSNALLVDLGSTGATWSHLAFKADLSVLVGIYSDKFFYTKEKPVLPKGFNYLVSNSQIGDTNLILEAFNCADHGHIKDYDNYQATYGDPELLPDIIESIHAPIHQAVSLSCYYKEYLRSEMAKQTDQNLLRMFANCAVLISHQEQLLSRLSLFLSKENHYLGQL